MFMQQEVCGVTQNILVRVDASSDAQFFVAVGVLAWLFVIADLVLYSVFTAMYAANSLLPLIVSNLNSII